MSTTPASTPPDLKAARARLDTVHERIRRACDDAGRDPRSVRLLAVSKTFEANRVAELAELGQTAFAENYLQEAIDKIDALTRAPVPPLQWHFIGPIQSNKTRLIAEHFDWVHSVDRERIARRLSEQRPDARGPLSVCIQVNVSGEASKSGCSADEARLLARLISTLPGLALRGLMAIPEPSPDKTLQRRRFAALRELKARIAAELGLANDSFDTLSMGMSDDLEAAIVEGATIVRVGTALFGRRT